MPAEGNFLENRMEFFDTNTPVVKKSEMDRTFVNDHILKLIEYDEGVPFQLMFGHEPGEGNYIFVGEGMGKLTGIDTRQISEKTFAGMIEEVIPLSENVPADVSALRDYILKGIIADYRIEMLLNTPAGEKRWIKESALTVKDDETGRITGVVGILYDVTEKRKTLASLAAASEKADESERLKNTFLQNISHEVRTPLNAIVGFSSLLCEPEIYYRKEEFVDMINNSTDHFLEIMDSIMEISRIEAGSAHVAISEINPDTVLKRIHRIFKKRAEESNLELIYKNASEGDVPVIKTDDYKFFQVMNNLVGNALKFTHQGQVEFGYEKDEDLIEFFVSDTGIGIEDEHKNKIFTKFYQAESGITRKYPGIGLGLSISKAYVEMLGGKIRFSSVPGKGTIFRFSLPL